MVDRREPGAAQLRAGSTRRLGRALLLAAGTVALIFVLYEIVERAWLGRVEMRMLHALHMLRGVMASIAAAVIVGWSIARGTPPLLASTPSEEEWARGVRPTEETRIANYGRWLIQMRWVAIVVATSLVFISVWAAHLLPGTVTLPLLATLAALALLNIAYTLLLESGSLRRRLLHIQVYGDLVVLVILLHFSGGIENPLSLIMLFHVIIGGIILSRLQCFLVAAAGTLLFGLLALAEWAHVIEHYTLQIFPHFSEEGHAQHAAHESPYVAARVGLQAVILFVTAFFVSTLVDRLRRDERQLEAMANRALADGQLLERSLETTGAALRVADRKLQSRWTNSRWHAWFGSAGAFDGVASAAQRTLDHGVTHTVELRATAPEGRIYQVTTAPLRDADGRVHQVVQLAQDVTDRRRSQDRLMRAGQLAAVGELAGQVAHEVNNPIAIISAKARLLMTDHRPEMSGQIAGEIDKIIHLSDRVARVAQGLLSYCRPSGAVRTPLELRAPIRSALAMIRTRARHSGIQVVERLPDGLPVIRANSQETEQVFLNLFLNALDAMPRGGTLTVGIEPEPVVLPDGNAALQVTVEDTGEGIPEKVRERIFEPFFTTKGPGRGTGLGLSICQGLVRSHGGRIGLDHSKGPGTRFSVALPLDSQTARTNEPHGEYTDPHR